MLRKKTSVLFVNAEGKQHSYLHIPTTLIKNWKKFLLGFTALILILIGIIAWLVYFKTDLFYQEKLAKADQKFKNVTRMVDVEKLKKSFQSIDSSLYQINAYLQQRGLKKIDVSPVGGEEGFEIEDVNAVANYYQSNLLNISEKVKFTPLGLPAVGEQTSDFGYRSNPFTGAMTESHFGLDFRGNIGDPVKTTADGTVSFSGVKGGYGNCIIIDHKNGFQTLYGHLSAILVKENQQVKGGDKIGLVGSTGRSTGPHLHYEVMQDGKKINPENFLKL